MCNASTVARLAVALLLVSSLGCSEEAGLEGPEVTSAAPASPRWNIVWVVLDAAGAGSVGLYGYERDTTPHIDALAREAVVFDRAYAQAPHTLPSAASYLTTRYPAAAVRDGKVAAPSAVTALKANGYRTLALSENPWVTPQFGFREGFDTFQIELDDEGGEHGRRDTGGTVDRALDWIRARREPFFVYAHLLPPHYPWDPGPPFAGRFAPPEGAIPGAPAGPPSAEDLKLLRALMDGTVPGTRASPEVLRILHARYDENLAFADHQVGRLVAGLRELGLLDSTILVVSADHGEAFGDHDELLHGTSLYDDQIHVPLVVRFPPEMGLAPDRRDEPVELLDVLPTLLEAVGVPRSPLDGESLMGLLHGDESPRRVARSALGEEALAVVDGPWKLIVDEEEDRLYEILRDPHEQTNLAARHPAIVERLRGRLDGGRLRTDSGVEGAEIAPSTRAELEALGYTVEE